MRVARRWVPVVVSTIVAVFAPGPGVASDQGQAPTSHARAQEASGQELSQLSFEELLNLRVTTAARHSQPLSKAPATIIVITERQIEERGYKDLKDIFRDLPGFDISENNAGEVRSLVIARGMLRNNKIMVLRDGKKLNSPGGELFVYGNNVPLADVKRIEILYGPSSAVYGADAFSAVVNMITKTVDDYGDTNGEVDVSFGTDTTWDVAVSVAEAIGKDMSVVASARLFHSDGVDVLDDFRADEIFRVPWVYDELYGSNGWQQPVEDYVVSARLVFGDLVLGLYRQDATEPNGPATDVTQNGYTYLYDDSYVWHQKLDVISLDHTHEGEGFSVLSSLTYTDYVLGRESGWIYSWGPQYKYATTSSLKLEELLDLPLGDSSKLIVGAMFEKVECFPKTNNLDQRFDGAELLDWVDYPDDPGLPDEYRGRRVSFGVFDYENYAVFAEYTRDVGERLQLNLGLRWDSNTDYKDVTNPRAGLIWSLDDETNLKLLYGEAYIAPSKYVAYEHWSAGGAFGYYPNPDLEPERLRSVALSFQRLFRGSLALSVNTFYNDMRDLIRTEGYPWIRNVNGGSATTKGLEVLLDHQGDRLSGYLYYSYLDGELEDGSPVPKVAEHKVSAGLTYRRGELSVSPRLRWTSDISKIPNPGFDESDRIDGHLVVDFTARLRRVMNRADLYLNAVNLFDEKYFAASPYGEGRDGWVMDKNPQPGRSLSIGLVVSF